MQAQQHHLHIKGNERAGKKNKDHQVVPKQDTNKEKVK